MSVSSDPAFLSCRATVEHDLVNAGAFAAALARLAAPLGLVPGRMILGRKRTKFDQGRFIAYVADPVEECVVLWGRELRTTGAFLYLRDGNDQDGDNTDRGVGFAVAGSSLGALHELLALIHHHFGLVSANIAGQPDALHAQTEGIRIGMFHTLDEATEERVGWDVKWWRRARTKLIRLSPITVIGPSLWATLPPMPRFDPAPIVEDLPGAPGCKVITAWPTLCAPRDPDFLRGTRALRAWLWPYTIQNPADDPANDPA